MTAREVWEALRLAVLDEDWPRLRALLADDCVASDHRALGFGELRGGDEVASYLRGIRDVQPDARPEAVESLVEEDDRVCARIAIHAGGSEAPVRLEYFMVSEVREERVARILYFPDDAREQALRAVAAL